MDLSKRRPVVSDDDRRWALDQCPSWAARLDDAADPPPGVLLWDRFVADQAERFEQFFAHERRAAHDWSHLWRKSWWPKADARKLYPRLVPAEPGAYPTYRRGTLEFEAALKLATGSERAVMLKAGLLMLRPGDAKIERIESRARAMRARMGDVE